MAQLGSTVITGSLAVTGDTNLVTPLPIASGGTGANTAAAARTNLDLTSKAAASGGTAVSLVTTGEKYTWNSKGTGTVTSITISATSPISVNSTAAIGTSGVRTISHGNSGVTAGSYNSFTVNATGHVTAASAGVRMKVDNSTSADRPIIFAAAAITSTTVAAYELRGNSSTTNPFTYNPSTGNVSAVSFTATSAKEKKKNISKFKLSALNLIRDTEIVKFKYRGTPKTAPWHVGFIADNTNELLAPEHKVMDYTNCIGILMKAVQELAVKVEKLEEKVNGK